ETTTQDLKDFEFTFIELKKFNTKLEDLNSTIDKWIYFINNASSFDLIPHEYEDIKEFKEAFEIANKFSWNKKELEHYDRILMREMDDVLVEEKRKNDLETAIKKRNIEIAKNLLDVLDTETIALKTGLSIKEVKNLINRYY
ncbi:MAG: PD-(D/E)XK nuclease family transposase, partial [Campylobacterota bacterium]|nr:PD-(D/E)XK nuclease family transposase [Campylobacterota bacterium]